MNEKKNDESKKNKYSSYLPENRYKKEGGIPPIVGKISLIGFWLCAFIFVIFLGLQFAGVDILKVESRNYNLNLSETINLSNVYNSESVVWETSSDNVTIEGNLVTATGSGAAYIIGREGDTQVSDVSINVLGDDEQIYIDNHDISVNVGDSVQVTIGTNYNSSDNTSGSVSSISVFSDDVSYNGEDPVLSNEFIESVENGTYFETSNETTSTSNSNITYESSNTSVALVDDDGNITPVSAGTATITVTDSSGNTDFANVTVEEETIIFYNDEYSLNEGDSLQIEYKISSSSYSSNSLKWSSEDEKVVVVDSNGKVTAVNAGTTYVKVSVNGNLVKEIKIVVTGSVLPSSLSLDVSSTSVVIGETVQIVYSLEPVNVTDSTVNWTSANTSIASVDSKGIITGNQVGTTTITATTVNGIKQDVIVEVKSKVVEVTDVSLSSSTTELKVGDSGQLTYQIYPAGATDKNVTFEYDDSMISLDSSLNFKALKAGTTTVKITTTNGHTSVVSLNITSNDDTPTKIEINEGNLSLMEENVAQLTTTITPANASGQTVSWKSSDTSVAEVSSSGMVTAISEGTATITATVGSVSSSVTITVSKKVIAVTGVALNKGTLSLKSGKTETLTASVSPSNASNKGLTWKSSDTSVATVSSSGEIVAVSKGTATITATSSENSSISASCVVTVSYDVSMKLSDTSINISNGSSKKITVSVYPSSASQEVTWSSSDKSVATVNSSGEIAAKSVGTAYITATSKEDSSVSIKCKVTVKEKYTVIINPSHQTDNKTVSTNSDYDTEKKSMYILAEKLKTVLEDDGYTVVLTPSSGSVDSGDNCWSIDSWSKCGKKYVKYAINEGKADENENNVYIALHSNATGKTTNTSILGPTVFYANGYTKSKTLSSNLCTSLIAVYEKYNVSNTFASTCLQTSTSVAEPKMYYTYGGIGASALIEIGFHDNEVNQQFIEDYGDELAEAVKDGIASYIAS